MTFTLLLVCTAVVALLMRVYSWPSKYPLWFKYVSSPYRDIRRGPPEFRGLWRSVWGAHPRKFLEVQKVDEERDAVALKFPKPFLRSVWGIGLDTAIVEHDALRLVSWILEFYSTGELPSPTDYQKKLDPHRLATERAYNPFCHLEPTKRKGVLVTTNRIGQTTIGPRNIQYFILLLRLMAKKRTILQTGEGQAILFSEEGVFLLDLSKGTNDGLNFVSSHFQGTWLLADQMYVTWVDRALIEMPIFTIFRPVPKQELIRWVEKEPGFLPILMLPYSGGFKLVWASFETS